MTRAALKLNRAFLLTPSPAKGKRRRYEQATRIFCVFTGFDLDFAAQAGTIYLFIIPVRCMGN